jgi:hypothetical protein
VVEADKAARGFTVSIVSAYRLAISKFTHSDKNNYIPAVDRILKHKRRLNILAVNQGSSVYNNS